jgi:hypothetical protein
LVTLDISGLAVSHRDMVASPAHCGEVITTRGKHLVPPRPRPLSGRPPAPLQYGTRPREIGRSGRSSCSAGVGGDDDVTLSFDADPVRREVRGHGQALAVALDNA